MAAGIVLSMLAGDPAAAEGSLETSADATQVGQWVEVRGAYDGKRRFTAESVELVQPQDEEEIVGDLRVHPRGPDRVFVLDQEVHLSDKTDWVRIDPADFLGKRAKVQGYYRGPRHFAARSVKARNPGRDRILGRVDLVRPLGDATLLQVMGYQVEVPSAVPLEHELELDEYGATEPRFDPTAVNWLQEDQQFGAGIRIAEGLYLSGLFEYEGSFEDNFDLNHSRLRDREDYEGSARLRMTWDVSDSFQAVGTVRYRFRYRLDDKDGIESNNLWRMGQTYLLWRNMFGSKLSTQVGRQNYNDPREWIYDQDLDALRAYYRAGPVQFELSGSTTVFDGSPRDESSKNLIGVVSNGSSKKRWAAYAVHRDFGSGFDERSTHLGVQLFGDFVPHNRSWFELSHQTGNRAGATLAGYGIDVGTTWFPWDGPVYASAGFALGTGDRTPGDGRDEGFRQTGLQDNNSKLGGVTSYRYYGELVDPELANLRIFTAGLGARLSRRASLDFLFHAYQQDVVNDQRMINAEIDARPNGTSPDLGWELDAVLGWREWKNIDVEIVGGMFRPGKAFDGTDDAFVGKIQVRYRL